MMHPFSLKINAGSLTLQITILVIENSLFPIHEPTLV